MPELPDITVYVERLQALAGGQVLQRVRLVSPFLLRTAVPPLADAEGRKLAGGAAARQARRARRSTASCSSCCT